LCFALLEREKAEFMRHDDCKTCQVGGRATGANVALAGNMMSFLTFCAHGGTPLASQSSSCVVLLSEVRAAMLQTSIWRQVSSVAHLCFEYPQKLPLSWHFFDVCSASLDDKANPCTLLRVDVSFSSYMFVHPNQVTWNIVQDGHDHIS
jgi:hypothetical protein